VSRTGTLTERGGSKRGAARADRGGMKHAAKDSQERLQKIADFIARTTWDVESVAPTRGDVEELRRLRRIHGKDWDAVNRRWVPACRKCGERPPATGGCCECEA
jgi:hypothetical protein